jgi:hypothetical protein
LMETPWDGVVFDAVCGCGFTPELGVDIDFWFCCGIESGGPRASVTVLSFFLPSRRLSFCSSDVLGFLVESSSFVFFFRKGILASIN